MSESQPSKVFMFDSGDPEMQRAYENARATFRYFWREVAWERRRIVPALDLACVKAPFSDGEQRPAAEDTPDVEHMWLSDVDFDGHQIHDMITEFAANGLAAAPPLPPHQPKREDWHKEKACVRSLQTTAG